MRSIASVFSAFANLAASINALAGVLDVATGRLRQTLAEGEAATVLEYQNASGDNASLDSSSNGTAKGRKARAGAV